VPIHTAPPGHAAHVVPFHHGVLGGHAQAEPFHTAPPAQDVQAVPLQMGKLAGHAQPPPWATWLEGHVHVVPFHHSP
jgi:hypothetical protein